MAPATQDFQNVCQRFMDRFFVTYPDTALQRRANKALRFVAAGEEPMLGKPSGWAAGIIYAMANRDGRSCGMPGMLNADTEKFFGVSMSTIRKRAGQVERALEI